MIQWSDNLKTGIAVIDEQHQQLFDMISNLDRFITSKDTFLVAIIALQTYVSTHFKTEEDYMKCVNYPDYENHKARHDKFVEDYKVLLKKRNTVNGFLDLGPEFVSFLENWVTEHYANEDVRMASFIKSAESKDS